MSKTSIEWTQQTWNPVRGCSRISPGCLNCYAERQAGRFCTPPVEYEGTFQPRAPFQDFVQITPSGPRWTGKVELVEQMLNIPLRRKKPTVYFVNSMSDLFHEALSDEAIDRVFAVMALCPQHTFQVLTKRAARMREYFRDRGVPGGDPNNNLYGRILVEANVLRGKFPKLRLGDIPISNPARIPLRNVWLGVSVENQQYADERIPHLLRTPAAVRFVSYEPALGPVDFDSYLGRNFLGINDALRGLDWVIVGGESGPGARPFNIAWARRAVAQSKAAGVPVFVKQLGADPREGNANGNCRNMDCTHPDCGFIRHKFQDRKGGDIQEWPEDLRVREMPS